MIIATNLEHLDPLPKPSVKDGWGRTVHLGDKWACDGAVLVLADRITKRDRAYIANHAKLPKSKVAMSDPDAERLDRLVAGELADPKGLTAVEFLGCASELAFLRYAVPDYFLEKEFTVPAAKLAYAVHLTKADTMKRGNRRHPLLLYRGTTFVGMVHVPMK